MTKEDIELLEAQLMEEVVKRRKLGGFDANAATILILTEALYKVVHHIREKKR